MPGFWTGFLADADTVFFFFGIVFFYLYMSSDGLWVSTQKKIYMFADADIDWCYDVMHLVSINEHNSTIWPRRQSLEF
jgi:hypothetical protein